MRKMFKLTLLFVVFTLSANLSKAQSTSLCDGVKYIYSNLTKANFDKLPEDYASRIAGWKVVTKDKGDDSYSYSFEYEVKNEKDLEGVFKKLYNQLTNCLGVKAEYEGDSPSDDVSFEYKEGAVMMYLRQSMQSQWVMVSVIR